MGDVVVARSAEVGKATGDGESAWVVLGEPELLAGDLDRGREAAIEVEEGDRIQTKAGHVEGLSRPDPHRFAGVVVEALAHVPVVDRVGDAVHEDPALGRHAESARARPAEQMRRAAA